MVLNNWMFMIAVLFLTTNVWCLQMSSHHELIGDAGVIHKSWIELDQRSYKIYQTLQTYDEARQRCWRHHPDAQLAVVTSYTHSQEIGKYLLKSKKKLSYAWIGAKWHKKGYQFEAEPNIRLHDISDSTGYPPWRRNKTEKSDKCLLLDRHVTNRTVFLEAHCGRLRPYICYIKNNTGFTDVIKESHGYRLHYSKRSWINARNYCKNVYKDYSAYLAEIREPQQQKDLVHLLRQKKFIQRIWLGGIYNKSVATPTWLWDTDKMEVPIATTNYLHWVSNHAYAAANERHSNCMALDKSEMTYGISCRLEQSYICQFSAASLKALQSYEKENRYYGRLVKLPTNIFLLRSEKQCKWNRYTDVFKKDLYCSEKEPSVFASWIGAGRRLYKIFKEEVSYNNAKQKCRLIHPDVELAVIPSLTHTEVLGKHLLSKTPAWIGARWFKNTYKFESEPIKLHKFPNANGYPPWASQQLFETSGCIALYQNTPNAPIFMQADCELKFPYICYTENGSGFTDVFIGDYGYRLHHNKKSWSEARDYCIESYSAHSAHLVEIDRSLIAYHVAEVMEQHKRATRHVWVGGKIYKVGMKLLWFRHYTCQKISIEELYISKDKNNGDLFSMEDNCMAMDILGNAYGSGCETELNYICQFSGKQLHSLQEEEKNRRY